ncbi:retrotransposon protein, putative, ty1-copia subclass [Tanacetum coccineum]
MGASRRSRRLFLASTVSINDVYIDIPQQKLRIIGWADPEKIIKAIKKTRKIVSICLETEPSPATEQPSGGGARAPTPDPETVEPPTTTHVQECATPQPFGSKEAEEIHVVQHYPQDHGRGHNHDRVYNESIQHYSSPPSRPQYKHKPPNPMHMRCLLIQHGWEAALDPFPETMTDANKTAALKTDVYKKAHSALLLCLDNKVVLQSKTPRHSGPSPPPLKKLSEHIDEFNKLVGDHGRANPNISLVDIYDEDLALMLLTSLPPSYDNFVETLLYGRELTPLEDVLSSHSIHRDVEIVGRCRSVTMLLCGSPGRKDCPQGTRRNHLGFVQENVGQGYGYEGYDNGDLRDFLLDFKEFNGGTVLLGDNRACAIMGIGKVRVQMKDGSSFVLENVRYIPELKRNLISLGTLDREGYTVKLQNGRVKVIKGSLMVLSGTMKGNCVYSLDGWAESGEDSVGRKLKKLRTDNGLEFCNQEFNNLCKESGIARHLTVAGTPQQNGLAERMNRTLLNKVRAPSTAQLEERRLPMDLWSGHLANYEMLRIFGCVAYSHVNQGKLKPRAIKCIFLGYPEGVKGYRLWREVEFEVELQGSRVEPTIDPHTGENPGNEDDEQDEGPQQQNLDNYVLVRDRAKRTTTIPARYRDEGNVSLSRPSGSKEYDMAAYAFTIAEEEDTHEPITFQEAINSSEKDEWVRAMEEEMSSLKKNHTWELVDQPPGQKLVSCKWLYKIKERIEGVQKPRVILSLTVCEDYELEQLDVKTAFLHGNLEETIYMRQPPGYEEGTSNKVCLLKKSLYGLKQSPRQWYKRFDVYMISNGFSRNNYDSCVYFKEFAPARKILGMEIVRDRAHFKVSLKDFSSNDWDVERMSKVPYANAVGKNHLEAMKWILKYLKGTADVGLVYGRDQRKHVDVDGFVDADYAKDPDKEAEYMALTEAVKENIWLKGLLIELGVNLRPVIVNCDNQSAIHLSRNAMFHERTKHINVSYHFIREIVESKEIEVAKIGTKDNAADTFTKVVPGPKFIA